jgi:hypothetical protein
MILTTPPTSAVNRLDARLVTTCANLKHEVKQLSIVKEACTRLIDTPGISDDIRAVFFNNRAAGSQIAAEVSLGPVDKVHPDGTDALKRTASYRQVR